MTTLLQQAFDAASKPPPTEQDLLAARLLAELAAEDEFDKAIAASGDRLVTMAAAALAEHRAGQTQPLGQALDALPWGAQVILSLGAESARLQIARTC